MPSKRARPNAADRVTLEATALAPPSVEGLGALHPSTYPWTAGVHLPLELQDALLALGREQKEPCGRPVILGRLRVLQIGGRLFAQESELVGHEGLPCSGIDAQGCHMPRSSRTQELYVRIYRVGRWRLTRQALDPVISWSNACAGAIAP